MRKLLSLQLFLAVSICFSVSINAQSLFTEKSPSEVTLDNVESDRLIRFTQQVYVKDSKIIQFGSISSSMLNGYVTFTIPGYPEVYTAETVKYDYTDDANFGWAGTFENGTGHIAIVSDKNNRVGFIQTNEKYFSLDYLKTGFNILIEHDLKEYKTDENECLSETGAGSHMIDICENVYNTCPATIHVLLLITPEAKQWFGDEFNNPFISVLYVWLATFSLDIAFFNSDIPNKSFRYTAIPFSMDFASPTITLNRLRDDPTGSLNQSPKNASELREDYKADLVIMLMDLRWPAIKGGAFIGPTFEDAYGFVAVPFMLGPRFTFAHEIAHTFGARHDDDEIGTCEHGWKFTDSNGDVQRTIMARTNAEVSGDPEARILHFSNPDIYYISGKTGTPDNNNALVLRNAGCEVAGHFDSGEMEAGIDGSKTLCNGLPTSSVTYTANVVPAQTGQPGQPPYTYEWKWHQTLSSTGVFLGSGNTVTIGTLWCPHFYLVLKVTSSDGETITRVRRIDASGCTDCPGTPNKIIYNTNNTFSQANIYPNPTNSKTTLELNITEESSIFVHIKDINGISRSKYDFGILPNGIHQFELAMDDLLSSIYFCNVFINGQQESKIILLNGK